MNVLTREVESRNEFGAGTWQPINKCTGIYLFACSFIVFYALGLEEKSRRVKVFDIRSAATEPLTWAELTASQSAEMALGHSEFGTCQLPSLSGRDGPSEVGTCASSCGFSRRNHESHFWDGVTAEECR